MPKQQIVERIAVKFSKDVHGPLGIHFNNFGDP